ncbi:unnamed protein product [Onchocerca flexuosa]|uniref:Por_Secre_tail domain-containing protein n=1 Tax=Onchocerca flexuosa TaxID=387005 RepID=A0A183HT06_9BILA|nr:unnamed protein product [Onchocerca flexuosa]
MYSSSDQEHLRTSKGAVVYRIEPENAPFDVTPFSGDIFSRYSIPNGKYAFDVVATDSSAQLKKYIFD